MPRPNKPWFRASKGTWYATVDGEQVSLGVRGRRNVRAAHEAWHRLMTEGTQSVECVLPTAPASEDVESTTIGRILRAFLADAEGRVKPRTLLWYKDFLKPFETRFGERPASRLTPSEAEAYSRRPSWGASTRNDFLGVLVYAFRWAEQARMLPRNPLAGIRRPPKSSRGAETLIEVEEHGRLLAAASKWFRPFLVVLHASGARPGEVSAIEARHLDPISDLARLSEHKTAHKTGRDRVIYLTTEAAALLRSLAEKHPHGPLLRDRNGKPWNGWAVVAAMRATRTRANLLDKVAYGYRHSFATDALANGVPDGQVAEILGHSGTGQLYRNYAHLAAKGKLLKEALGKVRGESRHPE